MDQISLERSHSFGIWNPPGEPILTDSTRPVGEPSGTEPIAVPANVAAAVVDRWGDVGERWLREVVAEFVDLSHGATVREVFHARYGFVVEVVIDDRLLVMRSTPDPDGKFQAQAARGLASIGVGPAVHEVLTTRSGTWTVMDRVVPGTPVLSPHIDQLADLLRPLVEERTEAHGLPPLAEWLDERLADHALADLPPGAAPAPERERVAARTLLSEITTDDVETLCHGDCSWGNVLQGPFGLVLIDPRGKRGDVAYDVGVLALKRGYDPRDLGRRVGVDPERAEAWAVIAAAARV
ncbi:phosphotransferase [Actinokineospora sp. HUAS TT18]|uniref:phosphotransferase n=1 Tax=Actinokineospora sp. HUAS TT18 TaxID=3447451 RepID=UPI003F51E537